MFDKFNLVFYFVFLIEAILKIVVLKKEYFKEGWNVFDLTIVIGSTISLLIAMIPGVTFDLRMQATLVRVFRILRVLKIIKRA